MRWRERFSILLGIFATALIALSLFAYAMNEGQRMDSASLDLVLHTLDEGMTLYAENCAVCHGAEGEGLGAVPALDTAGIRGADPETLEKIVARGLYDTQMPAWSLEDGGPLSDFQIGQLVALMKNDMWLSTGERVAELGVTPLVPFTAEPDPEIMAAVQGMENGDVLALGITVYANQCVACHGADGAGTALAPALNDAALRAQPQAEIIRSIESGIAGTLMVGWDKSLSEGEISAVVALIMNWDAIPVGAVPEPVVEIEITAESVAMGESLYASNCAGCHGPEGQGSQRAPALNVQSFLTAASDTALEQIITMGVPDTSMPAWGDRMTTEQIHAVVGFLRSWEPTAPEIAAPVIMTGPWWQTDGQGQGGGQGGGHGQGGSNQGGGHGQGQGGNNGGAAAPEDQAAPSLDEGNSEWLATQLAAMIAQTAVPAEGEVTAAATLAPENADWLATQLAGVQGTVLATPAPGEPTHMPQAFITQTAAATMGVEFEYGEHGDEREGGQGQGQGHGGGQGLDGPVSPVEVADEGQGLDADIAGGLLVLGVGLLAVTLLGLGALGMYLNRRKR